MVAWGAPVHRGRKQMSVAVSDIQRWWAKIAFPGGSRGCWEWTSRKRFGYGYFWVRGKERRAHRWAYEQCVGPIPDGMTLDHLCRNRACVNPAHLEPVTNKENVLRGKGITANQARQTHCKRGHPLSGANLSFERQRSLLVRRCRACKSARGKAANWYYQRKGKAHG